MEEELKLTKKQRHEIYKAAKEGYEAMLTKEFDDINAKGMCAYLRNAAAKILNVDILEIEALGLSPYFNKEQYPEFLAQCPRSNPEGYWFYINDFQSRKNAFNAIIKETEE